MFSIIVFLNELNKEENPKKFISSIFSSIKKQKNTELIFVINKKDIDTIDLIQSFEKKEKSAIVKYMYTSREMSFNKYIQNINNIITNDNFFILSYPSMLDEKVIEKLSKIVSTYNPDVIEFKPSFSGLMNWKPSNRLTNDKCNKLLKIEAHPEIVAYSYPFIYNKVFSTNVLNKTIKRLKFIDESISNIFFTSFIYSLLINSETYFYIPNDFYDFNISTNNIPNYKDVFLQWKTIIDIYNVDKKYYEEINYAKYYYLKIILCSLYVSHDKFFISKLKHKNENTILQKKYFDVLNQVLDKEYNHFGNNNKYMMLSSKNEANILKENYPISKWSKLVKELET